MAATRGLFGGDDDFDPNTETARRRELAVPETQASQRERRLGQRQPIQQELHNASVAALAACGHKGREDECQRAQDRINIFTAQLNAINEREFNEQSSETNARIVGGSTRTNFKKPISMDITRLINPQVKADALERINRITQQLRDSLQSARDNEQRAKASIDVGIGLMPGLISCPEGYVEWGLVCKKPGYCEGDPGKFLWEPGHQVCHAEQWEGRFNNPKENCGSREYVAEGGLCYNRCPSTHPHRITGMPYLCAQSPHAHDAIRRQAEWDFINKDDTAAAIECAEATLNRDQGRIEEKCGFSAAAKWKAIGEKIASGVVSYLTLGMSDIVAAARGRTANEDLFGHQNRGGEGGAAQTHMDGVIRAFITIKDLATEEACVRAIDQSDMIGYMNYCPLTYPATPPYEKDAQGNDIKFHGLTPPIDPNADLSGKSWADDFDYGKVDDSEVPPVGFDESRLPKFPEDLLQAIPDRFYPDPEKEDMAPPAWPADLTLNPNEPMSDKTKPLRQIEWNILDKPNSLLVLGGFLLAILSI